MGAPFGKNLMDDLKLAAPLAQALADKGYETLTAVQLAVLAQNVAGRDLLVSAQTGSGKTVAFGLAIAPEILEGNDKLLYADKPLALIVAPTRELALQVKREFEWLYAQAGAHIASCVGGMDYRTERRTLERGAHIVVGTPGRLRDHIERGSLDLSACRAVILDEADEMLDLGFADDLEFILSAAPAERRTLLFSATVPKGIESLAANFQNNALRIAAKGEARQHVDIEYRAVSVTARDKEHAIFNMLRFYEARTAIVFAKTRANVNHLFARMVNRGFQVVALSGELSQSERMHALQSLRDGRARVCIATDVAARGLDLPGLDLVIHADLPSNSETLLHRSGRTGRAGNKGVSALIVVPAEFKKAGRLLHGAKVTAEWGKAPSAEEVQSRDNERLLTNPAFEEAPGDDADMAAKLLAQFGADAIAAAFIRQWREGRSAPEVLSESLPPSPSLPPRERGEFGESVWFRLSAGHDERAEARWLLPKICEAGGISKDGIGAIRVKQDHSFVQIAAPLASRFGAQLELEPGLLMVQQDEAPNLEPTQRGAPRPARDRAAPRPAHKSYDKRSSGPRSKPASSGESYERAAPRASAKSEYEPRKPYEKAHGKPQGKPEGKPSGKPAYKSDESRADRPSFAPKGGPRESGAKYKSSGFKSHGGSGRDDGEGRPARAAGSKSHKGGAGGYGAGKPSGGLASDDGSRGDDFKKGGFKKGGFKKTGFKKDGPEKGGFKASEGKPADRFSDGASGKPSGKGRAKPSGGKGDKKPSFGKKAAAPARALSGARDTSKRFVPPKSTRS